MAGSVAAFMPCRNIITSLGVTSSRLENIRGEGAVVAFNSEGLIAPVNFERLTSSLHLSSPVDGGSLQQKKDVVKIIEERWPLDLELILEDTFLSLRVDMVAQIFFSELSGRVDLAACPVSQDVDDNGVPITATVSNRCAKNIMVTFPPQTMEYVVKPGASPMQSTAIGPTIVISRGDRRMVFRREVAGDVIQRFEVTDQGLFEGGIQVMAWNLGLGLDLNPDGVPITATVANRCAESIHVIFPPQTRSYVVKPGEPPMLSTAIGPTIVISRGDKRMVFERNAEGNETQRLEVTSKGLCEKGIQCMAWAADLDLNDDEVPITATVANRCAKNISVIFSPQKKEYEVKPGEPPTSSTTVGSRITIQQGNKRMIFRRTDKGVTRRLEVTDEGLLEKRIQVMGWQTLFSQGAINVFPVRGSRGIIPGRDFNPASHLGIDIMSTPERTRNGKGIAGDPILAFHQGIVCLSGWVNGYGNVVYINHLIEGESCQYQSRYAHLHRPSPLAKGRRVEVGEQVGVMGATGNAREVHLHFEIRESRQRGVAPTANNRDSVAINPLRFVALR